jgi:hypothetical protein
VSKKHAGVSRKRKDERERPTVDLHLQFVYEFYLPLDTFFRCFGLRIPQVDEARRNDERRAEMAVNLSSSEMKVKPTLKLYQTPAISRIMIPLEEWDWTLKAVCFACVLSRSTGAKLVLVELIPVQHPSWMGTPLADLYRKEYPYLPKLEAMLEKKGIPFEVRAFHFLSFVEAIVQAAERYKVQVVFARVADSFIPFWQKFQGWRLRKSLEHNHRQLYESAEQLAPFLRLSPSTRIYPKSHEYKPRMMVSRTQKSSPKNFSDEPYF